MGSPIWLAVGIPTPRTETSSVSLLAVAAAATASAAVAGSVPNDSLLTIDVRCMYNGPACYSLLAASLPLLSLCCLGNSIWLAVGVPTPPIESSPASFPAVAAATTAAVSLPCDVLNLITDLGIC